MKWRIVPVVLVKALLRGTLWHPQTVRLLRTNLGLWLEEWASVRASARRLSRALACECSTRLPRSTPGATAGREFCERARAAGVHGVHAGVSAENAPARHFFEQLGFTELQREARFRKPDGSGDILYTILYASGSDRALRYQSCPIVARGNIGCATNIQIIRHGSRDGIVRRHKYIREPIRAIPTVPIARYDLQRVRLSRPHQPGDIQIISLLGDRSDAECVWSSTTLPAITVPPS